MSDGCKIQVQDHTDHMACGDKIFRAGYCEKHWYQVLLEKGDKLRDLERQRIEVAKDLADFVQIK